MHSASANHARPQRDAVATTALIIAVVAMLVAGAALVVTLVRGDAKTDAAPTPTPTPQPTATVVMLTVPEITQITYQHGNPWVPDPAPVLVQRDPDQLQAVRQVLSEHSWTPGTSASGTVMCTDQPWISMTISFVDGREADLTVENATSGCEEPGSLAADVAAVAGGWDRE